MTLFGALSSGVSGLSAQSSAIGAISDNITNLSTVGYKSTQVDFQTLVTKQTSATFFSAGGVQSRPRQDTGTQGLLASSTSATDIALAGSGFFVVNEAASATISDEYLFTRAGSFFQDNEDSCATPRATSCRPGRQTPPVWWSRPTRACRLPTRTLFRMTFWNR